MSLVNTFPPVEDESGLGYYRRLAAENSLRGWRELSAMANVAPSRAALLGSPDHVANELGLETAWTRHASRQEQKYRAWRGLQRTHDAVCPACLADGAYVRYHWEHAYLTACPLHQTCMMDRCPSCAELLRPNRERIELCPCGFDLRSGEASPATSARRWLSALIATAGASTAGVAPRLKRPDLGAVCNLVRILCLGSDPLARPARNRAGGVKTIQEATEFLAPLDHLLSDWPAGFEAHVGERIAAGYPLARTLNTLLGNWYTLLKKVTVHTPLEPFLKTVIEVAATRFNGTLSLDTAQHLASEATQLVRAADAAKTLGVSRDQLVDAIKAGTCEHRSRLHGTRGFLYEVPRAEVERIAAKRQEWISEAEACELAGVEPAVLRQMVAAEVVVADAKWRNDVFKGGPVHRASIQALHERLTRATLSGKRREGAAVLWSELTSRRMGDHQAIQAVMRAAAAGDLRAVAGGSHLGQMVFLKSEVAAYFGTPMLEAGMSIHQLAKATGWKWESISNWIAKGLLGAEQITLRGQRCRVVMPDHLLEFRRTYVPLADLAQAIGTRSSSLAERLSGIEIVGAQVLPNGVRRGGLVRIADLGRLALAGARVSTPLPA